MHFEQCDDRSRHRAQRAVQRRDRRGLALRRAGTHRQPAGLEIRAVRGAGQLEIALLAWQPRLTVELAGSACTEITTGDVDNPERQLESGQKLPLPAEQPLMLLSRIVQPAEREHLDLVEPVHPDDAAGVLAVAA